jgi:adenylate cyclase
MILETDESTPAKSSQPVSARVQGEHLAETKLRLVQRVSEQLVRIFDPQQLLDAIMTIVVEQTGADRGLLCLLDEARQPVPIAARGISGDEKIRVSRTVLGRLLNGRTGVLINQSPDEESNAFKSLEEMAVQSTMCVPLWTGDNIVGILSLDSTTSEKRFDEQDLELLLAVAHQVAVGIERNRLSHQIETERQMRDYLSKYLDHSIVEQISHGQSTGQDLLAPVEREVTILFSDIVAFTKMSESLSAVDVADFLRKYLTSMTEVIFSYGGTIDKYIGDAVMALFGAPVPSDDGAAAAIRAALAMRNRVKEFDLPRALGNVLRVRVGINTGPVVVGNLGSERRSEYTAVGDAVNVASRLETFARPNEICIDENTYEKTKGAFVVEEIGTIDVKNRAEPVAVYKVIRTTSTR